MISDKFLCLKPSNNFSEKKYFSKLSYLECGKTTCLQKYILLDWFCFNGLVYRKTPQIKHYLSVDRHLGSLHFLTLVNGTEMNMNV